MAEMNGPIMYQNVDVRKTAGPSDFLLILTDTVDQQHGAPLTRGQAQILADKLSAALKRD